MAQVIVKIKVGKKSEGYAELATIFVKSDITAEKDESKLGDACTAPVYGSDGSMYIRVLDLSLDEGGKTKEEKDLVMQDKFKDAKDTEYLGVDTGYEIEPGVYVGEFA